MLLRGTFSRYLQGKRETGPVSHVPTEVSCLSSGLGKNRKLYDNYEQRTTDHPSLFKNQNN